MQAPKDRDRNVCRGTDTQSVNNVDRRVCVYQLVHL